MTARQLRPVRRESIESQAADSLREFIVSGALAPGARLTELALAEQLGIARATLRAGLHRLAGEGIVTKIPYRGWQVASLSGQDAWEIWTLRGSLERLATSLLTARADPTARAVIEQAYARLLQACAAGDMQQISQHDFALHRSILDHCGHTRLQLHYEMVEQQVRLFIATSNAYVSDGPEDIIAQHRPIVEAILAGDAEKAGLAAWHHNEQEGRRLLDWLRSRESAEST